MALSPFQPIEDRVEAVEETVEPGLTYEFDFNTGQFTGRMIDGIDALKQFAYKALSTARFRYLIYSDAYGSEIETLIPDGNTYGYTESEIKRFIYEALIYDDRIENVTNYIVYQKEDALFCECTIIPAAGEEFTVTGALNYG